MPTERPANRALVCVPRGPDWETEITVARLRNSGFAASRRPVCGAPTLVAVEVAQLAPAATRADRVSEGVLGSVVDENYRLGGGDRLRIRSHDRYTRCDLDGEYIISEGGRLRLPGIGTLDAQDKTVPGLEREIRRNVERGGGRLGHLTIDVTQCRPFYVTGLANCPGAYPYVPGYTVLHAVSVAGGLCRAPLSSATDPVPAKRILTDTMDRIAELVARRARLEAERDGAGSIGLPQELGELEPVRAAALIASETSLLEQSREAARRERSGLENIIRLAIAEFQSHGASLARINARIEQQTEAFGRLRTQYRQGAIDERPLFEASASLNAAERSKQEAYAGLTRATGEMQRARNELSRLALASSARAAEEIARTDREIARLKAVAAEAREGLSGQGQSGQVAAYRIMRRSQSGELYFEPATETTPIQPGDVLEILSLNSLGPSRRP